MHHRESESDHNHNHYRLRDNKAYTPLDFNQHLQALAKTEVYQEFFLEGEIDELCGKFALFHQKWVEKVSSTPSLEEQYVRSPSQRLEVEDVIELELFVHQQEPCRINTTELNLDYEAARKEIERIVREGVTTESLSLLLKKVEQEYTDLLEYRKIGGSCGLNSAIASSCQIKGSVNPVIKANMGMDDKLTKEVQDIPTWASSVLLAVKKSKELMLAYAKKRIAPVEAESVPTVSEPKSDDRPSLPEVEPSKEKTATLAIEAERVPTVLELKSDDQPSQVVVQLSKQKGSFLATLQQENESAKENMNRPGVNEQLAVQV